MVCHTADSGWVQRALFRLAYSVPKPGFHTADPCWAVSLRVHTATSVGGSRPGPQSTGTYRAQVVGPDRALSRRAPADLSNGEPQPGRQPAGPNQAVKWLAPPGSHRPAPAGMS